MDCTFLTCVHTFPEFLYFQYAYFKKYLKQSFTFLVVDDSEDPIVTPNLKQICKELGYHYVRCLPPSEILSASFRHARALKLGWNILIDSPTRYIGTIDTDLFPILPLDLDEVMKDIHILTRDAPFHKFKYFWPGIAIFKTDGQPIEDVSWDIFIQDGKMMGDTGSSTTKYIEQMGDSICIEYLTIHQGLKGNEKETIELAERLLPLPLIEYCKQEIECSIQHSIPWRYDIIYNSDGSIVFFHLSDMSNWSEQSGDIQSGRIVRFINAMLALLQS